MCLSTRMSFETRPNFTKYSEHAARASVYVELLSSNEPVRSQRRR